MTTTKSRDYPPVSTLTSPRITRVAQSVSDDLRARDALRRGKARFEPGIAQRAMLDKADATAERLARAEGGSFRVGDDGVRRIADAPLDRLFARGNLDKDAERACTLKLAGETYRKDWTLAGLVGVGAMDTTKPGGTGGGSGDAAWGMPRSERAAFHRMRFRKALAVLSPYFASAVNGIVLEDREPDDVGREIAGRRHIQQARAVALDRLVEGLRLLAIHYGMVRN